MRMSGPRSRRSASPTKPPKPWCRGNVIGLVGPDQVDLAGHGGEVDVALGRACQIGFNPAGRSADKQATIILRRRTTRQGSSSAERSEARRSLGIRRTSSRASTVRSIRNEPIGPRCGSASNMRCRAPRQSALARIAHRMRSNRPVASGRRWSRRGATARTPRQAFAAVRGRHWSSASARAYAPMRNCSSSRLMVPPYCGLDLQGGLVELAKIAIRQRVYVIREGRE